VAYIGTPGEVVPEGGGENSVAAAAAAATEGPAPPPAVRTEPERRAPVDGPGRVPALPAARRLANELGINLTAIAGTGQDGVITVRDVERASEGAHEVG